MIAYTARALREVGNLQATYARKGRIEAIRNLQAALRKAEASILTDPRGGLPAPRPYPGLARRGRFWVHAGGYWVRYTPGPPATITNIFWDRADIPGRV